MPTLRVSFAGLSPISERIVRQALARDGRFQVVEPWTALPTLGAAALEAGGDILFIELVQPALPSAMRAMLAAATRLRIVAIAVDATWVRIFELREHQMVMTRCVADDLCEAITGRAEPAAETV